MSKVIIVGGGVIGLAAGAFLVEQGGDVTIVDRGRFGSATSSGNLSWITPGISSSPLAAPGVIKQALKWMAHSDSPFWIRPRADLSLIRWLWRFRRACSEAQFERALRALVALNSTVLEHLDRLHSQGVEFEFHQEGLLYPALSRAAADKDARTYERLTAAGYQGEWELLDADAIHDREPELDESIRAGVYSLSEAHLRPESFTRGLAAYLERQGVTLLENAEVRGLEKRGDEWAVQVVDRELVATDVLVAAGVWSDQILARVGVRLNLLAGKGYSITYDPSPRTLKGPLYLSEAHAGVTPFDGALRIGGTFELTGIDPALRKNRLDAIRRSVSRYLGPTGWSDGGYEWAGLRPVAPDGLPVIGAIPGHEGLYVATGHGMVGMTMSTSTGAALAPMILNRKSNPLLEPFTPRRIVRT